MLLYLNLIQTRHYGIALSQLIKRRDTRNTLFDSESIHESKPPRLFMMKLIQIERYVICCLSFYNFQLYRKQIQI